MLHSLRFRLGKFLLAGFVGVVSPALADGEHGAATAPAVPTAPPAPAADGWLEWGLRGLFYAAVLLFVAALVVPRLVARRGGWPVPEEVSGSQGASLRRRQRRVTADLGWLATGAGAATVLVDAATWPGGRVAAGTTADSLLDGPGAGTRIVMVLLLAAAVVVHRRRPQLAAPLGLLALAAVALAAQGAAPRAAETLGDALLLIGGMIALGGIGLVALVWAGPLRRDPALRATARRRVLAPFTRVALPAAVVAGVVLAVPPPPGPAQPAPPDGPCSPCPLPAAAPDELALAANAGSQLVAAWIRRSPNAVTGTVRVRDLQGRPSGLPVRLPGLTGSPCGPGCTTFRAPPRARAVAVEVTEEGRRHVARLPTAWWPGGNARARRLVAQAQGAMRGLTSVRQIETVTSGPGSFARTDFRLVAPDRMAFRTDRGVQSVVDGDRQWRRVGSGPWTAGEYGAGLAFRTGRWFRWTPYARTARLLGIRRQGGRRVAQLALYDPGTPVWLRLDVALATRRVLRERVVARAYYMTARYRAFDRPLPIALPEAADVR